MNMDVDGRRPLKDFNNLGEPAHAWEFASLSNERDRPALAMPKAQPIVDALTAFGWRESRQNALSVRDLTRPISFNRPRSPTGRWRAGWHGSPMTAN